MKRIQTLLVALCAIALLPALAQAEATKFRIRNDGGSRITFVSDAPLETITGVTSMMTGKVTFDPGNLKGVDGKVEVPIVGLRTGVDLRDEHLRGKNWLDAKNHPDAIFEITKVTGASALKANKDVKLKVQGKFTLHGVTKPITASAKVKWIPLTDDIKGTPGIDGDVLRVKADFSVKLTDYGVSVPAIVRLKVSNEIAVSVDLRAIAEKK